MSTATATNNLPDFAVKVADALEREFSAKVEAERTGLRDDVRFLVRSDRFSGMWHTERQRRIWEGRRRDNRQGANAVDFPDPRPRARRLSRPMPTAAADPAARFLDPRALARVRSLELRTRAAVEGMMSGRHRSPLQGSSVEFAQHRPYVQGDDTRRIDWKVFGRSRQAPHQAVPRRNAVANRPRRRRQREHGIRQRSGATTAAFGPSSTSPPRWPRRWRTWRSSRPTPWVWASSTTR